MVILTQVLIWLWLWGGRMVPLKDIMFCKFIKVFEMHKRLPLSTKESITR